MTLSQKETTLYSRGLDAGRNSVENIRNQETDALVLFMHKKFEKLFIKHLPDREKIAYMLGFAEGMSERSQDNVKTALKTEVDSLRRLMEDTLPSVPPSKSSTRLDEEAPSKARPVQSEILSKQSPEDRFFDDLVRLDLDTDFIGELSQKDDISDRYRRRKEREFEEILLDMEDAIQKMPDNLKTMSFTRTIERIRAKINQSKGYHQSELKPQTEGKKQPDEVGVEEASTTEKIDDTIVNPEMDTSHETDALDPDYGTKEMKSIDSEWEKLSADWIANMEKEPIKIQVNHGVAVAKVMPFKMDNQQREFLEHYLQDRLNHLQNHPDRTKVKDFATHISDMRKSLAASKKFRALEAAKENEKGHSYATGSNHAKAEEHTNHSAHSAEHHEPEKGKSESHSHDTSEHGKGHHDKPKADVHMESKSDEHEDEEHDGHHDHDHAKDHKHAAHHGHHGTTWGRFITKRYESPQKALQRKMRQTLEGGNRWMSIGEKVLSGKSDAHGHDAHAHGHDDKHDAHGKEKDAVHGHADAHGHGAAPAATHKDGHAPAKDAHAKADAHGHDKKDAKHTPAAKAGDHGKKDAHGPAAGKTEAKGHH